MADNSPRQARRQQAEPSQSVTPGPKLGSANQTPAIVAEARSHQVEVTPPETPQVEIIDRPQAEPQEPQRVSADQLAPLQEQIRTANERAQAEFRARQESERQAGQAQRQVVDANRVAIDNGLAAAKAEADAAEAALAEAHSKADGPAIAKHTRALTAADRRIGEFEAQKRHIEAVVTQQRPVPQPLAQAESMTIDGRSFDLGRFTPVERTWIRAHPEFATDAQFYQRTVVAAQMALSQGLDQNTQAYIDFIDAQTKDIAPQQEAPKVEPRKTVSAAAPVSRSATPQTPGQNGKLTLSRVPLDETNGLSEVEAAEISHPDLPKHEAYARYAQDREALISEGKIQRRA